VTLKRLLRALVPVVLFLAACGSFAADFRKTTWLMSREQIIAAEGGNVDSETDFAGQHELVFRALVNGHSGAATYLLENNQLRAASYNFRNDEDRQVYGYMKDFLTGKYGKPSLQKDEMVGWRLERTEIALAYLPNRTCYVAFWEKTYFARMNNLGPAGDKASY
jgi:hypothetical protein